MKQLSFIAFTTLVLLFSGCSSKKYFEPETTFSASLISQPYGATIVDLSRNGATLDDGTYIGTNGINDIKLGEGYRFLNENKQYVLASNTEGILKVIDKKSGNTAIAIALHTPVVSATMRDGIIAYILNTNTFGIYRMSDNRKLIESRSERIFAVDTRAASPMFIDNLAIMPMLDGKLIIVNIMDSENAKVVYISSETAFDNVIYLARVGNMMIAATPNRIITLGNEGKSEYQANISEVTIDNGKIYLFTKEGKIIVLDKNLNEVGTAKFKFAHYAVATAFSNKVYGLDQQGSLIVLNSDLTKSKIYDVGAVDEPAFITGKKLYKDGKVIDLSKLGYE
ncbi:hypothetical protein [Sulfurimonas sp.]|uniref:hypothetical protein n=1 Tax=Sulfurimonas sp. TaxID=2022749 RepID=UPI002608CD1B|nr:hypothetical protein [Sulfurimonas sp.]